jgi:hypothetical protein
MVKRSYEVLISQTRTAVVKVRLEIEALGDHFADLARDEIYDTINRVLNLGRELQHITASPVADHVG